MRAKIGIFILALIIGSFLLYTFKDSINEAIIAHAEKMDQEEDSVNAPTNNEVDQSYEENRSERDSNIESDEVD